MEISNINNAIDLYGVKALVYLKHNESIESLSTKLSKGLELPRFIISNNEEYPHDLFGRCECLGFEVWLNKSDLIKDFLFQIEIGTQDSIEEIFYNKMHNVSPWLGRYISRMCSLDTCFFNDAIKKFIFFKDGEITQ